jgi:MtrB/PioB family decaheme-associated outer membrane protein
MGDGFFLERLRYNRERNGWFLGFTGDHLGRLDQRLAGSLVKPGRLKISGLWDQIPMLLSRTTETLFVEEARGVLTVPNLIQGQVEPSPSLITTMVDQFSRPFDLKTRRYVAEGAVEYLFSPDVTLRANVRNVDRKGDIPFGGSFGHGSFVETPAPIEYRITDTDGSVEYARGDALIRGGYTLSWFRNDVGTLLFDNPYRLTDATNATSIGRFALPPSNSFLGVNGTVSYRLPRRTRLTAYVSTGSLTDTGDAIVSFTPNTAMPALALDRPTVDGEARTNNVNVHLTSRPADGWNVAMRYKYFNYDNRTPHFDVGQRVTYDASLSSPTGAHVETEPFGVGRHTFDADLKYSPTRFATAGVGYSRIGEERTFRIFHSTTDNVVRLLFDTVGTQWFTVRAKYEHAERRGTGIEEGEEELFAINELRGMRHYDVADRNRNRVTVIGTATPAANVAVNLSVAAGTDDYLNSEFGVLDNTHRVYSMGVDVTPAERSAFGVSYSYEDYRVLSQSRQWAPTPPSQRDDVSRNWSTDGDDRAHSVIAYGEITGIRDKIDLRLSYDFSRARALYFYDVGPVERTLPEDAEIVPSSLPPPTQLPEARSTTHRGTIDFLYALTERLSAGVSYWRDQYRVSDFTLDAQANPTVDRGNALLLGYIYRPYTANTFWGRLVYAF